MGLDIFLMLNRLSTSDLLAFLTILILFCQNATQIRDIFDFKLWEFRMLNLTLSKQKDGEIFRKSTELGSFR